MTQSNDLNLRVDHLKNDNIDIKLAIGSLIETVNLHQRNFEVIVSEMREMQFEIREMQFEIRGLQVENRRIL